LIQIKIYILPWIIIGVLNVALFVDILEIEAIWFRQVVNSIVVANVGATTLQELGLTVIELPGHVRLGAWSFIIIKIIIFLYFDEFMFLFKYTYWITFDYLSIKIRRWWTPIIIIVNLSTCRIWIWIICKWKGTLLC